ncbi:VirD4-like conjugal transfer protein, CD1115 family [Spiroplasma sp. SV19]|uniref:VirD4-like conjugal transfer protein, CD1115 family n=1 Tax=Spiroplasma sp. SV19 TaxID=2570468 RepID=UPI0024B6BDCD|nr:type IV secretory system conjugative DNA transfer family protein [Spiroplasma sp. SV19]WHQ37363.1 TraM recognition domain-containing protein [Spiroplasma sp. SV19]
MKQKLKAKKHLLIFFTILFPFYLTFVLFSSAFLLSLIKIRRIGLDIVIDYIKTNENNTLLYIVLFSIVIYLVFVFYKIFASKSKIYSKESKNNTYGSAKWLSDKEIDEKYAKVDLFNPKNNYGIVVKSEENKKGKIQVNIRKDAHTIIVAGTRAGKTQGFVKPTLQVMARCSVKPSLCITDPKGELYSKDSQIFKDNGYNVIKIDLRNPEHSYSWNVLASAFSNWEEYCRLEKDEKELNQNFKSFLYKQKAIDYINDICETLFFSTNSKDEFWNSGARDITKGILLGILYEMKESNSLDQNKFNLAEIIPIVNNIAALKDYFLSLPSTHVARIAAGSIDASGDALNDIASTLKNRLNKFSDPIIRNLISQNEIDLSKIISEPTVIFLVSPDDKKDKDIFASLFITQLYKLLIEQADNAKGKLTRPFYFMLDEFPTLVIPDMDRKITVSGGRNIWFTLVIQSRTQLNTNYKEAAETILDNCHMHIIIQTMNAKTAEYYSKFVGKKTIESYSYSNKNKQSQEKGIELISSDQVMKFEKNEGIVIYTNENPLRTKFIPMWEVDDYPIGAVPDIDKIPMTDDEFANNYFFDLSDCVKENKIESSNELVEEKLTVKDLQKQKIDLVTLLEDLLEEEKFHSSREIKEQIKAVRIQIDEISVQIKSLVIAK